MENQEQISDSMVRKIQLLLQLAERAEGNEVEAAAAMAKAQDILARYNLDLSTIQDKVVEGGTNTPDQAMAKRDYSKVNRSAMYQWQRNLVRGIAEANYCKYWITETNDGRRGASSRVKRHKVLGRVANTTVVLMMADYLFDTIERLVPYKGKERLSRSANSWREGCADRLILRIEEKAEAMKAADYATQGEAAYSTAIAIRNLVTQEEIGNYDFQHGDGAWARKLQREADYEKSMVVWREEREAREAKELKALEEQVLNETPAEKLKREKREAKQAEKDASYSARYWAGQDRKARRERERRDPDAYRQGTRTGESIGLDSQLSSSRPSKSLN